MKYNTLVDKIQSFPQLRNAIDQMVISSDSLNLVTPDWENVLKNSPVYVNHVNKSVKFSKGKQSEKNNYYLKSIIGMENNYDVIVAGYFCFKYKQNELSTTPSSYNNGRTITNITALSCRMCNPLVEIGNSMKENDQLNLSDNCMFFINRCDLSLCDKCFKYKKDFDPKYNEWCVLTTKIFDGENIKNTLRSVVENAFKMDEFIGIVRLKIFSRYTYSDNKFKIGGRCQEMILFKESALNADENINFIMQSTIPPQITFEEVAVEEDEEKNMEE